MSQIWRSLEDTGPYGSFPSYPLITTEDNEGRGVVGTPGSIVSAQRGVFGTLRVDNIEFPALETLRVPSEKFPTIQSAIDELDGRGPINANIIIAPGTYYETILIDRLNSSSSAFSESRTLLKITGDERPCAGLSYTVDATSTNPAGTAGFGGDGCPIEINIDEDSITVILNGEVLQPDFAALGVVAGDTIIIRSGETLTYQQTVTSVSGNVIHCSPIPDEIYSGNGASVTICPNVIIVPISQFQPAFDITNSSVLLSGLRIQSDALRTPFIPHLLRAHRSFIAAPNCMFDDLQHCTYDDCVNLSSTIFVNKQRSNGTCTYNHTTIAGGFTNTLLAERKSLVDVASLSLFNASSCHGLALTDGSHAIATALVSHTNNNGVQVYISDNSAANIGRLSAFGNFLGVLVQNHSSIKLGTVISYDERPSRTIIAGHFLAFHARNGSSYNVDGDYTNNTWISVYLSGHSSASFNKRSTRTDSEESWYSHVIPKGCSLSFQDQEDPESGVAKYTNGWWYPFKDSIDTHILDSANNIVVYVEPWRNDYMGNYLSLGRIYTVICKNVEGEHALFLQSGGFYGTGLDGTRNMAHFTAVGQSLTFCCINDSYTVVIANNGVTFSNWWW